MQLCSSTGGTTKPSFRHCLRICARDASSEKTQLELEIEQLQEANAVEATRGEWNGEREVLHEL